MQKKRTLFTLIILITLSLKSFGQLSDEKAIYGRWHVEKIIEKPTNSKFQPLIDGFNNSTFSFNENGDFELTTTSKSELFGMITDMTSGTKWKFEQKEQYVKIGNAEDGYSIMGITVREINGNKLFRLEETGITLQMKKSEKN